MSQREIIPTHSAFLELKEERVGLQEGYRFLDEKRLILASELLSTLERYDNAMRDFRDAYARALTALVAAVARHGLEGLAVYPPAALTGSLERDTRSVLGVPVLRSQWRGESTRLPDRQWLEGPEGETCRESFEELLPRLAALATLAGNLERLRDEYTRTARRARALEDVLLPEIDEALRVIDTALEEQDREEAIRVRRLAPSARKDRIGGSNDD